MKFCIIGAGFSGTSVLHFFIEYIEKLKLNIGNIELVIIEQNKKSGPGMPYKKENSPSYYLCNNSAESMSIFGNDFVDWMDKNKNWIIFNYPELIKAIHLEGTIESWIPNNNGFYPRALFGLYLENKFSKCVQKAKQLGIKLNIYQFHTAVDGYSSDKKFHLQIICNDSGKVIEEQNIDKVFLGVGHWSEMHHKYSVKDNYFSSPYPPPKIDIKSNSVYVEGMGPSGIDAILGLTNFKNFWYNPETNQVSYNKQGELYKIICGSRSGFFPAVRGKKVNYQPVVLTKDNVESIDNIKDIVKLLDKEIKIATGNAESWSFVTNPPFSSAYEKLLYDLKEQDKNSLIHQIFLIIRRMKFYRKLSPEDKKYYDSYLDRFFIRIAVPIPEINAKRLLALINAGVLETKRVIGHPQKKGSVFYIKCIENGICSYIKSKYVIQARGQSFNLNAHPSQLIKNLIAKKEICPNIEDKYVTGGIALESNSSYNVIRQKNKKYTISPYLSSFGPLVRYWMNENNFSQAFTDAARWVANDWKIFLLDNNIKKLNN